MDERNEKVEVKDVGGENPAGENQVEIEVGEFADGECTSEVVSFAGEFADGYHDRYGDVFSLYECPAGYRVHVEVFSGEWGSYLHPVEVDRNSVPPKADYGRTFTAEEVAKEFPLFGSAVGHPRIQNLD